MRRAGPIVVLIAATAAPAAAQGWTTIRDRPVEPSIERQVARIDRDIRDGRRTGQIDRRSSRDLRRENGMIGDLADRYAAGGLSAAERAELQTRTEVMRSQVIARRTTAAPTRR